MLGHGPFFSPAFPTMRRAYRHGIAMDELPPLLRGVRSDAVMAHAPHGMRDAGTSAREPTVHAAASHALTGGVYPIIADAVRADLCVSGTLALVRIGAMLLQVFCVGRIIDVVAGERGADADWVHYMYAVGLAGGSFVQSLTQHNAFHIQMVVGLKARALINGMLYRHALRMRPAHLNATPVGTVINLMSNDSEKIWLCYQCIIWLASCPFECAAVFVWMGVETGWATNAVVALSLLMIPIQLLLGHLVAVYRRKALHTGDERVKATSEFFGGVAIVKVYAWEKSIAKVVESLRAHEVVNILRTNITKLLNISIFFFYPQLMSLSLFALMTAYTGDMNPKRTFIALALISTLAKSLHLVPRAASLLAEALVALRRLDRFLSTDLSKGILAVSAHRSQGHITAHGSCGWGAGTHRLSGIDIDVTNGELIVVVGVVGSGKSTLLHMLMGNCCVDENETTPSTVSVGGTVAYVPQEAWIVDGTVRDNIVFGITYDEARYRAVLKACALVSDLDQWGGDLVEVGEKGITLSGGQRQRISMARACYADADVYLLDDPISAVDPHVGHHLMTECIRGLLAKKTVVLVTHQYLPLKFATRILVIDRAGHQERLAPFHSIDKGLLPADLAAALPQRSSPEPSPSKADTSADVDANDNAKLDALLGRDRKLVLREDSAPGVVGLDIYQRYTKAGGLGVASAFMTITFMAQACKSAGDWWFSVWSQRDYGLTTAQYVWVLFGLVFASAVFSILRSVVYAYFSSNASKALHDGTFQSVLFATPHFFESVPLGRIVNRFAKDVDITDDLLPRSAFDFFTLFFLAFGSIVVICIAVPWFALAGAALGALLCVLLHFILPALRQVQRIAGTTRSPVFQQIQSHLQGVAIIRAFQREVPLAKVFGESVDKTSRALLSTDTCQRWAGVRIDWISQLCVLATAVLCVALRDSLSPGIVGLAITQAITLTGMFQYGVRCAGEVETWMTSVERLEEYAKLPAETADGLQPDPEWPKDGGIRVANLTARHPSNPTVAALADVSFTAAPGSRLAVVGRTGAGKSTLLGCFFRMLHVDPNCIFIDGVDITTLHLHAMRKRLAIIPQSPILFYGSFRYNLDPFGQHSNDTLWAVLRRVQLEAFVKSREGGLDGAVGDQGESLSVGQKQLICVARAMLLKPRVVFLDEATANADTHTDELIQQMIRTDLKGCTVVTIAHRLQTIMDYDAVVVLDKGRVVEYGVPSRLVDGDGAFANMVASAANNPS